MNTPRRNRKPTFLWQGMLIVLPALMMAGFGLWSLRQDRMLARVEVSEKAQKIAKDLAVIYLPGAFNGETVFAAALAGNNSVSGLPESAPPDRLFLHGEPAIVCLLNAQGKLIHPAEWKDFPEPELLTMDRLTASQGDLWTAAQAALFEAPDTNAAQALLKRVMEEDFPGSFPALAAYQRGVLFQDAGNEAEAQRCFEWVIAFNKTERPLSEGGLPLRLQAGLRLLQMPAYANPKSPRVRTLTALIANEAIRHPTQMSAAWLAALPENEPWMDLWQDQESGRILAEHWRLWEAEWNFNTSTTAASQKLAWKMAWHWLPISAGRELLVVPSLADGGVACLAITDESAARIALESVRSLQSPAYFGLQIDVAGKSLLSVTNDSPVLADSLLGNASSAFRVQVRLVAPDAFYSRQRTRTLWMGALIALSMAAVLVGFATAWRAFRRQQQLSEMKTNFVSSVSHELRAPIASVRLMAEELTHQDRPDPARVREYHSFIAQECRRLSGLIENVLDFSRHEQGRKEYTFESTDLEALLTETSKLMQSYASAKNITIRPVVQGTPEPFEADGRALQQVLVNLIDNAIKHSPQDAEVEAGVGFEAHQVSLWVEDHGEGIPPGEQQRIFERFYRRGNELRRETQGVGLGLAIVKNVVEAHNGSVTVRSALGKGSRFTVTLPIHNHAS
jgi:signal transduction histidine kinase